MTKEKLKKIFTNTVESKSEFKGSLEDINYISVLSRAGVEGRLTSLLGNNVCGFLCSYQDSSAVLIVFAIPISAKDDGAKHVAERVMQIVDLCEECFVTLDYLSSKEIEEDRFVYVVVVKKFNELYLEEIYNERKKSKVD
jgi:hypothetical protein